jgi:SAM-dependent methyltransferase
MTMDARFWDERYGSHHQLFSGAANGVLVTEVADLPAGRALDVGCGEGGDALWLARRGWQVTAVDISRVALERAAATTESGIADRLTWTRADLTVAPAPRGPFDLVSVHYFPLPHQDDHAAVRGLLEAVAPGGTLLFVSHDLAELPPPEELGVDPNDFYQPGEVAKLLDDRWAVQINETRPRAAPAPHGTHHTHDTVLRARRVR